jgi:succinyl-diaminopimelate desuccinylase
VAEHCTLELDLRIPWGCTGAEIIEEVRAAAPRATMRAADCSEPNLTRVDAPIVTTTCREIGRVRGRPGVPIVQWAASDAKVLRVAGFDVVEYGPGDVTTLHGIDERVPVAALESATAVYGGIIRSYEGASRPAG